MTDPAHWLDCLRAFLHDPPDKALDIKGHEGRAARYLAAVLDTPTAEVRDQTIKPADWLASAIERLPLPKGTIRDCDGNEADPILEQPFNRIPREKLRRCDPVTGEDIDNHTVVFRKAQDLRPEIIDRRASLLRDLAQVNHDPRARTLALWRLLPDLLPKVAQLPGDTRLCDHAILDHADAAAACCAALRDGSGAALLVFSLGPVQSFIVQGRSLRDLWTGSYLLSWLTFHAMRPILEDLGPWCITSPGLRGNPLCDQWLQKAGVKGQDGDPLTIDCKNLRWAGIPNTFTALVPIKAAGELRDRIVTAVKMEWRAIVVAVHEKLKRAFDRLAAAGKWDWQWYEQCDAVWDIRCRTLPITGRIAAAQDVTAAFKNLRATYQDLLGELPQAVEDAGRIATALQNEKIAPAYVQAEAQGFWTLANELAQRLLEADKRARLVPPPAHPDDTREKCALFPGFAVMGPNGDTGANREWWKEAKSPVGLAAFLRTGERLSAPGLVKRFAYGAYFKERIGEISFDDTREAAFKAWVQDLTAKEPRAWKSWSEAVKRSDGRAEQVSNDEDWQRWSTWELLDRSSVDDCHWLLPKDSAPTRKELDAIRKNIAKQRQKLLAVAALYGLPDEPRPYYAVLCADGDDMGKVLRGEKGPTFAQAYHPWMLDKLKGLGLEGALLNRCRPQGLAAQLAFSSSLNVFTREAARAIEEHQGSCVYAGGDDVLAVLPVSRCLAAAARLAELFKREVGGTLSCGLAVVHCSDDLRVAIDEARKAEDAAKVAGKDGLVLRIVRRSGETTAAYCPWIYRQPDDAKKDCEDPAYKHRQTRNLAQDWQTIAEVLAGQSDRWIHHLLAEQSALRHLPLEAVWARARHLLLHGEEGRKRQRALAAKTDIHIDFPKLLDLLREVWADTKTGLASRDGYKKRPSGEADPWLIDQFLTWCQHAAWLSRFMLRSVAVGDQT